MEQQTPKNRIFRSKDTLLEFDEETQMTRLKILGMQRRLLHVCIGLPTFSMLQGKFKSNLFYLVSNTLVFWFIPHTITQFMALYQHINNTELLADLIFQIALYIQTGTMAFFFCFTRKELRKYLDLLETQFVPNLEELGLSIEHKLMLKKHTRKGNLMIRILFGHWCWILFSWAMLPALMRYYDVYSMVDQFKNESLTITNTSVSVAEEYRKYFGILIWLPNNIDQFPVFEIFYLFDFVGTYGVSSWCASEVSVSLVLMHNITMHFKLLLAAIDDLDIVISRTLNMQNAKQKAISDFQEESNEESQFRANHLASESNTGSMRIPNVTKCRAAARMTTVDNSRDDLTSPSSSEQPLHLSREREEIIFNYLVQCVKYHQALLGFCEDVNQYLGPVLLIFFLGYEAMVIFSAVRLAMMAFVGLCVIARLVALVALRYRKSEVTMANFTQGLSEGNFKFFSSVVYVIFWPLVICAVGQELTNQMAFVGLCVIARLVALVALRYRKSEVTMANFTQGLSEGNFKFFSSVVYVIFWPLVICAVGQELTNQMGNKVYAIFTLLKRMMADESPEEETRF